MWKVFEKLSLKYLDPKKHQLVPLMPDIDKQNVQPYDLIVLGGGSIIHPNYINILHRGIQQKKKVMIWGSGIDSLDKQYIQSYMNRKEAIASPFSKDTHEKLKEVIEKSVYVGVRGPLTRYILQNSITDKPIEQSLDPGLLIEPHNHLNEELKKWKGHKKLIGLNWGTSYNKIFGGSEVQVEDYLVRVARKLIQSGYKIYMYIVWWRDRLPASRLYKKIGDPHNVILDETVHSEYELMTRIKQCELTINFKLHANILSAVTGVPFVALGYRMKVLDFALSVDLPKFVISTDCLDMDEKIIAFIQNRSAHQRWMNEKIRYYADVAKQRLEKPFQEKLYL